MAALQGRLLGGPHRSFDRIPDRQNQAEAASVPIGKDSVEVPSHAIKPGDLTITRSHDGSSVRSGSVGSIRSDDGSSVVVDTPAGPQELKGLLRLVTALAVVRRTSAFLADVGIRVAFLYLNHMLEKIPG